MADKRRIRGIAIHRPIVYGSVATVIPVAERIVNPDHNMRWTIAVRSATSPEPDSPILKQRVISEDIIGGCDDLSYFVKKVSFKLHDSYPNPLRVVDKPPFELSETGWGEFIIYIKIYFVSESGEKAIQLQHGLKLHDWTPDPNFSIPQVWLEPKAEEPTFESSSGAGQSSSLTSPVANPADPPATEPNPKPNLVVHSWHYDEVVFTEPTEAFYNILLAHPPTPPPPKNRFPSHVVKQISNKGESGEFTTDIAERELKKLDWAELKVLMEIDKLRGKLSRDEREITQIKKFIQQSS